MVDDRKEIERCPRQGLSGVASKPQSWLTKLQPAYVEDVGEAVTQVLQVSEKCMTLECGGPRVYSYDELLRAVAREARVRPILFPSPSPRGTHCLAS
jgi:uncharacterized protein YbjT (DUF2867 family)